MAFDHLSNTRILQVPRPNLRAFAGGQHSVSTNDSRGSSIRPLRSRSTVHGELPADRAQKSAWRRVTCSTPVLPRPTSGPAAPLSASNRPPRNREGLPPGPCGFAAMVGRLPEHYFVLVQWTAANENGKSTRLRLEHIYFDFLEYRSIHGGGEVHPALGRPAMGAR